MVTGETVVLAFEICGLKGYDPSTCFADKLMDGTAITDTDCGGRKRRKRTAAYIEHLKRVKRQGNAVDPCASV